MALIATFAGTVVVLYASTFDSMVARWSTEGYRHAFLIPVVSVALLWRARKLIASELWSGGWLGVVVLLGAVWAWIVARASAIVVAEQFAAITMILALVLAATGMRAFQCLRFPLGYLYLAVPFGSSVIVPLMEVTADVVSNGLRWLGTPAYREGMVLWVPGGAFEVAEACSGLNYLNAGIALGMLVAHLEFKTLWKQLLYVASVALVLIVWNGIRALVIVMVGSATDMQVLTGQGHVIFGWVLFGAAAIVLGRVAIVFGDRT